jgi:TRAP-type transport system small permease protein
MRNISKRIVELSLNALEFLYGRILAYVAAFAMLVMMFVTFVDVVGRDLFSSPLPGGFEVTEFLLAILIFLGLPMVTAANEHVDVDLLDSTVPEYLKPIQNILIILINIMCFGVLSWMLWKMTIQTYEYQDTTAILQIPYTGLVALMAMCSSLSTAALVLMLFVRRGKPLFSDGKNQGSK